MAHFSMSHMSKEWANMTHINKVGQGKEFWILLCSNAASLETFSIEILKMKQNIKEEVDISMLPPWPLTSIPI